MQQIYKVFLSLIIICLVSLMMPFNISADSTYLLKNPTNGCSIYTTTWDSGYPYHYAVNTAQAVSDIRVIILHNPNNTQYRIFWISQNTFKYVYTSSSAQSPPASCNNDVSLNSTAYNLNGATYWYNNSGQSFTHYNTVVSSDVPVIEDTDLSISRAIYYTFGEGASDTPTFGDLKIGFETSIAYSGGNTNAWRQNKDTIYFDRYDTLGNDLFGYLVELQAIPYSVEGASQQNIFAQGINDYVFDTVKIGHLGYWSPGQKSIDFTWEYVTNRFSPTWWGTSYDNWSLYGWVQNEHWYRVGWAYRARLVDEEDNVLIDWQWIYNGTSIDGSDVNEIINNNGLTPELVHSINNINNNNNTTNNNYYNNQVINYNSSDPTPDGSWIEQLISSILQTLGDLIGKILDFFSSIFDGLVDLILGLFGDINPADSFFNWFSNLFNGIGEIDLTLPQFNIPNTDLSSFNRLVQETLNIFSFNNFGFVIFIPLLLLIIKAVF